MQLLFLFNDKSKYFSETTNTMKNHDSRVKKTFHLICIHLSLIAKYLIRKKLPMNLS